MNHESFSSSIFRREATNAIPPVAAAVPEHHAVGELRRRILIADDDALVRGSLAAVLELEGYTVDEAGDGHEAVRRAAAHAPDLVLLDLDMPGWDGWTAFSQLDRVAPLVPVVVITARPNQYEKAVKLGVDALMEKPLDFHILLRAIRRLTSEDSARRMRRSTNRTVVTKLLGGTQRDS